MDLMTLVMAKPKKINLNDYGIDLAQSLVNETYETTIQNPLDFWEKVNTHKPLRMICAFTLDNGLFEIEGIGGTVVSRNTKGDVAQINFTIPTSYNGILFNICIAILRSSNNSIRVKTKTIILNV